MKILNRPGPRTATGKISQKALWFWHWAQHIVSLIQFHFLSLLTRMSSGTVPEVIPKSRHITSSADPPSHEASYPVKEWNQISLIRFVLSKTSTNSFQAFLFFCECVCVFFFGGGGVLFLFVFLVLFGFFLQIYKSNWSVTCTCEFSRRVIRTSGL